MNNDNDSDEKVRPPPDTIYAFRNIRERDPCIIPEEYSNRKRTDFCFVFFLLFFIIGYIACMVVCAQQARPLTSKHGYDKCGNICGMENKAIAGVNCSGRNLTDKPQMTLKYGEKIPYKLEVDDCAADCPEGKGYLGRNICYLYTPPTKNKAKSKSSKNFFDILGDELKSNGHLLAIQVAIGLGITILAYAILMLKTSQVLKPFFILGMIVQLFIIAYFIYKAATTPMINSNGISGLYYIVPAIGVTLIFLISLCYCCTNGLEFQLALRLIEESIIIFRLVPQTLTQPLVTLIFEALMIFGCVQVFQMLYTCDSSALIIFAMSYNLLFGLWLLLLADHCQYMIIAGAFAPFYFTRDRSTIKRPLCLSYAIVVTFHLGTLIMGSLMIAIIAFIRETLHRAIDNPYLACIVNCLLECCEDILDYVAKRTYIITFLHGQSFCKSAKRAVTLLWANLLMNLGVEIVISIIFINLSISLLAATLGIGFILGIWVNTEYFIILIYIGGIIVGFVAGTVTTTINTGITTIFLCFCEDQMLNDGKTRPYYMPKSILLLLTESIECEANKKNVKCC